MKSDIVDWMGEPRFPKRKIVPIDVDYTDEERRIHRTLVEYSRLRLESAKSEGDRYATEFVLKLLKKRLFSSPAAFASTLERHRRSLMELPKRAERGRQAVSILHRAIGETEEEYADDALLEESLGEAVQTAGSLVERLSERELDLLKEMSTWAERARTRDDSKMHALVDWLIRHIRTGGEWSDRKVIVFTEYRATQNHLVEMLTARGFGDRARLMTIYGGMDKDQREQIKAAFQSSPAESAVRILVATDAASEGIDLQNHCNLMIHAEIPWNPNRLEQRNGRIDRHGQRQPEVLIHHFVGAGYRDLPDSADISVGELEADLEFLMHAVRKVERIREDLGRVGSVIAEQVEEAMLGRRRRLNTETAESQARAARGVLAIEKRIREQIERLHERLLESRRRLDLTPENIRRVVEVGLEISGQPALQRTQLQSTDASEPSVFYMPAFSGTWKLCTQGLSHPHTGHRRPITFDQRIVEGRDDVVLVHLEHRLVQMCLRLLRAEIWAPDAHKRLNRVTARIVSDAFIDTPAVIGHARLMVIGEDKHRLHEEVIRAGGAVRQGRFARLNVGQIESLLEQSRSELPPKRVLGKLRATWPKIEEGLVQALEARKLDRLRFVVSALARRREKDLEDIGRVLQELLTSVEAELATATLPQQLLLWADAERDQFRRNVASLRARANSIPDEIARESELITRRYANPVARIFPVALTFVVPESLCK
jgi:hypothetical protein